MGLDDRDCYPPLFLGQGRSAAFPARPPLQDKVNTGDARAARGSAPSSTNAGRQRRIRRPPHILAVTVIRPAIDQREAGTEGLFGAPALRS